MIRERELEKDYMKGYIVNKMGYIENNKNLKERLEGVFPVMHDNICIDMVNSNQLLEFKKSCNINENSIITCRPLKESTDEESLNLFNNLIMNGNNFLLGIYDLNEKDNSGDRIIGRISLYDFNVRNRSVEIGYLMNTDYRGKGIMHKAIGEVCSILFNKAGINKIYAQTASFNRKSIGLLLSSGFKIDARLREHHEYEGKLYDDYIFSIIAGEFCR